MRIPPLPASTAIAMLLPLLFLLQSCQKNQPFPLNPDLTPYYIGQIAVAGGFVDAPEENDTLVYSFTYNRFGDPLTVKHPIVGTGNPNAAFIYDKYGRLSALVRPYENGHYESYVKYFYNDRNEIASDSQYIFGLYVDSIAIGIPENGVTRHWYKYDGQSRIIQITDSIYGGISPSGSVTSFAYDGNGDLVNGSVYDNRVSYRRTNAIWMFLSADYSVHNAFHANSYNAYGLPLVFAGNYPIGDIVSDGGTIVMTYGRR